MVGFWALMTPLAALVGIPWTLLTRNADWMYGMAMWIARNGIRLGGVQVDVLGRERLDPRQAYIFMSNHVSNLDPPLLVPLLPRRTSVMVKKELFRVPFLGPAMRLAWLVEVDRSNRDAAIASVHVAAKVLREKGLDMTIFPEGTRSRDGRLLPFKKGPFYLALETGIPVVPVTILGTYELWPKEKWLSHPGETTVVFHPPIQPSDFGDRDALEAAVRGRIASVLPEERR